MDSYHYIDRHHILHSRRQWESDTNAERLRSDESLIVRLDRYDHERLHANTPTVPLLGYHALQSVANSYRAGGTPLQSVDNLMFAIERSEKSPKAHEIEKHLAELAIWALDLQRPYIAKSPDQPSATVIDLGEYRSRTQARMVQ